MTIEQAIEKYMDLFGGIPMENMGSWSDEKILSELTKAIETKKPIQFDYKKDDII